MSRQLTGTRDKQADRATGRTSKAPVPKLLPRPISPPQRFVSPLMLRIMAVNILALVFLVAGVLYLNDYRQRLISARVDELSIQARIIAGALGETAARQDASTIDLPTARQIILRLVGPTQHRARLFSADGRMTTDSLFLAGDKRVLEERLPPPTRETRFFGALEDTVYGLLDSFSKPIEALPFEDRLGLRADHLIEVKSALAGEAAYQIRERDDGFYVINVAVPVQRFRRVLGALLLTAQTQDIEAIVRVEKLMILRVFVVALAITLLMSFFLSAALVSPIRVLARAAERVRRGLGREERLPEFAERRDEIGDLSRSLSAMTRALYNQIDAVERFAADVAHELKNPLTSMHSAVETLERTDRPDHREKLIAILKEDVQRLERLITDVSEASRLDAELTRGDLSPVAIDRLLASIVDGYRSVGLNRECRLRLDCPDDVMVAGIESRLGQVWRNLIDNALSFSPEGGEVNVTVTLERHFVKVDVCDEGPGLPSSSDKIFKRFYSERPDGEKFGAHSGLGLAISQQIIEAHGGRIIAVNRTDAAGHIQGARFSVTLPRARTL